MFFRWISTYANYSISGYNDFTLNANGIAAISKTGISKFSARNANYDVAASSPPWVDSGLSSLYFYMAEQGTGYKPKLVVTYDTLTPKTSADAGSGGESLFSRLLGAVQTGVGVEGRLLAAVLGAIVLVRER